MCGVQSHFTKSFTHSGYVQLLKSDNIIIIIHYIYIALFLSAHCQVRSPHPPAVCSIHLDDTTSVCTLHSYGLPLCGLLKTVSCYPLRLCAFLLNHTVTVTSHLSYTSYLLLIVKIQMIQKNAIQHEIL